MTDLVLKDARVVQPGGVSRGSVAVSAGRIERIVSAEEQIPPASNVVDLGGRYLAPGFVDIHIHGSNGVDVQEASDAELDRLAEWLARQGTTRFLPTFVPTSLDRVVAATAAAARWMARANEPSARPVGVHFEGPFVSHARCGALKREYFLAGDRRADFFDAVDAAGLSASAIRMMTIAPEIEDGLALVGDSVARGYVVSIGHTEAGAERLDAALELGARHVTHLANAMPPIHHRAPGPVAWALLRQRVTVDVIADLRHLHADMLRLVFATKTSARVALISDAIAPAGLGDGTYTVWGEPIRVEGGTTANDRGSIAGSVITLYEAFATCVRLGVPVQDAVRMASTVPARVLGLENAGAIAAGRVADLVAFDDDLELSAVWVEGRTVAR